MSDWRHSAECRDYDPETWWPIGTTGPAVQQAEDAKAICRTCPVIEACLDYALAERIDHGIFGGLTEDERRLLKRRQARAADRTPAQRVRALLAEATARGITYSEMERLTGMARASLAYVANGKHPNVKRSTEAAIVSGLEPVLRQAVKA